MDKWNLSPNVLLFDVLTILIHHFMLFFSILSQKDFMSKGKTILGQAAGFFPLFYVGWTYFLIGSIFINEVSQ